MDKIISAEARIIKFVEDRLSERKKFEESELEGKAELIRLATKAIDKGEINWQQEGVGCTDRVIRSEVKTLLDMYGYKTDYSMSTDYRNERLFAEPDRLWLQYFTQYRAIKGCQ